MVPLRSFKCRDGSGCSRNSRRPSGWSRPTAARIHRIRIPVSTAIPSAAGRATRSSSIPWLHSEKEHVIERFTRTSKNYLIYQLTVEDPEVLVKPFVSAPHVWTLAQDPNDVWTEYVCTANEEPDVYKNLDQKTKEEYERSGRDGTAQPGRGR
jgi:hypothetical protein